MKHKENLISNPEGRWLSPRYIAGRETHLASQMRLIDRLTTDVISTATSLGLDLALAGHVRPLELLLERATLENVYTEMLSGSSVRRPS